MLVLSRKLKQEIMIGDNIKITVLKIKGNTVRLGIEAPRDIHVLRGEIPKKSEVVGIENSETETMADFTVVFTNSNESQGSQDDLIPFEPTSQNQGSHLDKQPESTVICDPQQQPKVDSIRFTDRLPQVLHHNRLREIVSQLTNE